MIHPEANPFVTSFHMHATACAGPGVHLCEPFSPLGGAPPSIFSLLPAPISSFLSTSVSPCSRVPSDKSPCLHAVLGTHPWFPLSMHLRGRSPPDSRVVVAPPGASLSTWSFRSTLPPLSPCPKTASLPLMRHGLGWATVLRQRDAFLSCFNLMVRPPSDPFLSLCSSASC